MTNEERFAAMLLAMMGDERTIDEEHDPRDWGLDDDDDDVIEEGEE